ncbi:MAG: NAD(P)-dependent oxidoreductase [Candidatus Eremiobacteraeota bacterium]|nr:NAD(P)-dependent oxidoreductase [Candidatus Eremiobacteraeota bacterium]
MKILVTGGAGYVGCALIPLLLEKGHSVRVLDSLIHGGRGLLPLFSHRKFEFLRGDIRDREKLKESLGGIDIIIHLAAIVGYPACKKSPQLAEDINFHGTVLLERTRDHRVPIIFASTGSNYGAIIGEICKEETLLSPLTIYGKTKTDAENHLMHSKNTICMRFATAFGISNRLRLDLLINDFVYQAKKIRNLIIYEKSFRRTFIHVRDMARAFMFAVDHYEKVKDDVYNVGSEKMNLSKEEVAMLIRKKIDFYLHFADVGKDEDQRNYEVCYDKISTAGYTTTISVEEGIDELIKAMDVIDISNEFSNV